MIQRLNPWYYVALALLCIVTFFVNSGDLPTDIMEIRNLVTATEIVNEGNWLVPTMNGELRLEKPPLPTWVAGGIEVLCHDNMAVQRLAAGLMGLMWVVFTFLLMRFVTRRDDYAAVTVVVMLTCYNFVLMSRSATWDIYCHAWMMGGIYFLWRALKSDGRSMWGLMALAGLMMGLSFLSKGPVSFYTLLLPFLISYGWHLRPSMKGKWGGVALLVVVMLVVGGWWYGYLLLEQKEAILSVAGKEAGAWSDHNVRPWYYYWQFFLEMGVWAVLMLAALAVPVWLKRISRRTEYILALTWTLAALILLSLMPEKKMRYLLPLLAPSSMLVATIVMHFRDTTEPSRDLKILFRANGYLVASLVALLAIGLQLLPLFGIAASLTMRIVGGVLLMAVAVFLFLSVKGWHPMRFVAGVGMTFAVAELFLLPLTHSFFGNPVRHSIAAIRERADIRSLPFYHSQAEPLRIEMVYYAKHKILPIDLTDSARVAQAMPFVLVSQDSTICTFDNVDTLRIGFFDDNIHPPKNKHYRAEFLNFVTIFKQSDD